MFLSLPLDFYDKCEIEDEKNLEIYEKIDQLDLLTPSMSID
jgi:hypothetical protein